MADEKLNEDPKAEEKAEEKEDVVKEFKKLRKKYHAAVVAITAVAVGLGFLLGRKD